MARIGHYKRLTPADHPDIPDKFLQAINTTFEDITNALMRGLTFSENFRAEVIEIDVQDGVSKQIKLNSLKRNPVIGLLGKTNYFEPSNFTWEISQDKALTVNVNVSWDVPPDNEVRCVFLFVGGDPVERNN